MFINCIINNYYMVFNHELKIVIVDDDHRVLSVVGALVKHLMPNSKRISFNNILDASNHINNNEFDLLITDNSLNGSGGVEGVTLCGLAKMSNDKIKTILITGSDLYNYEWHLPKYVDRFLLKPIRLSKFEMVFDNMFPSDCDIIDNIQMIKNNAKRNSKSPSNNLKVLNKV